MPGHVGEHRDAVREHLEEPATYKKELLLAAICLLNAQRPRLEDRHQRSVAREHAKLAISSVGDDELKVALKKGALHTDDTKRVFHADSPPHSLGSGVK